MIARTRPSLRPYQLDLTARARMRRAAGVRRTCLVAVTGAGKTVMGADLINSEADQGGRVLFLAHRTELIDQACDKLASFGVRTGVIQGQRPGDPLAPVQVASVQTMARRLQRRRPAAASGWAGLAAPDALAPFSLIVIDECHHATADGYGAVMSAYPDADVLGLTATPYRLDGSGLRDVFDVIESGPQIAELIRLGFLVRPVVYAPPSPVELAGIRLRRGDYALDQVERVLDQTAPIAEMIAAWRQRAAGRTTVGFACTVEHARHLAKAFCAAGIPSEAIGGDCSAGERAAALGRLASGQTLHLWNCMLLTEGWDLPRCAAVQLARPTMSRCLWRQMTGRGLRPDAGKTDCVILDHVGSVHRFGAIEEPDQYSLDGVERATDDDGRSGSSVLHCGECRTVIERGLPCCPSCGWVVPRRAPPSLPVRGELELEQARAMTEEQRRTIYWQFLTRARERGFREGWAAHRYRERFGAWPPRPWAEQYELECA